MIDFIVVGQGLAANVLMHRFHRLGISFKTIGRPGLSSCSMVAGGIWNPIVFKRMTKSWMADDLLPELARFYSYCETTLNRKLMHPCDIVKPFMEEQEKTLWLKRAKNELDNYLDPVIRQGDNESGLANCIIPGDYGLVKQAGYIDVAGFLESSAAFFAKNCVNDVFDYTLLQVQGDHVVYEGTMARNIIFCEGFLVKNNPFFCWVPLKPAKGEVFVINSPGLQLGDYIFNHNGFILRQADGTYKVGATYAWNDQSQEPTARGKAELEARLSRLIRCGHTLASHQAGIRPASADRRPIIGRHPNHANLYVFNGLGTKGVMLAPYFSENFVHFYLQKAVLNPEVDVKRFYHIYESTQKKQS